jgi:hypothetical protein
VADPLAQVRSVVDDVAAIASEHPPSTYAGIVALRNRLVALVLVLDAVTAELLGQR